MSFDQGHTSKKWQSKDSNGRPVLFRAPGPPQTLHNLIFYHLHFLSARASQRPGRNHTKIPLPASECPYFPQEPELQGGRGEGRPHGSAVPSSQPACREESRKEVREAEVSGRSIGTVSGQLTVSGLSQHKGPVTLGGPSQDLNVLDFAGPCHLSHLQGAWQNIFFRRKKRNPERGRDPSMPSVPMWQGQSSKPGPPDSFQLTTVLEYFIRNV